MGDIDFKFTELQEKKYLEIMKETKKDYPQLFKDEIETHRTKVIIAHHVIFNNKEKEEIKEDTIEVQETS